MAKYVLVIEESVETDKGYISNGKAKIFYSFKSAYKRLRRIIKNKAENMKFPFIDDGKKANEIFFFCDYDDELCEDSEEEKAKGRKALDVIYNTLINDSFIFDEELVYVHRESSCWCECYGKGICFDAVAEDFYKLNTNAFLPPQKDREYYFFYRWNDDNWNVCRFNLRLLRVN